MRLSRATRCWRRSRDSSTTRRIRSRCLSRSKSRVEAEIGELREEGPPVWAALFSCLKLAEAKVFLGLIDAHVSVRVDRRDKVGDEHDHRLSCGDSSRSRVEAGRR